MTKDEALKLALEALENLFGIPDKWTGEGGGDVAVWRLGGSYRAQQAITAIKEALAQPEQTTGNILMDSYKAMQSMKVEGPRHVVCQCDKCKAQPEACKECHLKDLVYDLLGELKVANLKLSVRAKRTWVGLTDEELSDCMDMSIQKTCRAIEAKLKEKNT